MSPNREQAELLLGKAREDLTAATVLAASSEAADPSVGFHAQQAVEKALKAVLAVRGTEFPWTHDLQLLIRRLESAEVDVPSFVLEARRLGPWAIEYRYGEVIAEALDREWSVDLIAEVIRWAETQIAAS